MPNNNRNPIRTALVGCGKVGHTLHRHSVRFLNLQQCATRMLLVPLLCREIWCAVVYGFADHADRRSVGLLSVCTPHPVHAESIVIAAESGVHY